MPFKAVQWKENRWKRTWTTTSNIFLACFDFRPLLQVSLTQFGVQLQQRFSFRFASSHQFVTGLDFIHQFVDVSVLLRQLPKPNTGKSQKSQLWGNLKTRWSDRKFYFRELRAGIKRWKSSCSCTRYQKDIFGQFSFFSIRLNLQHTELHAASDITWTWNVLLMGFEPAYFRRAKYWNCWNSRSVAE